MRIVVVGGSASNVGKTLLAERLIAKESRSATTVAMKVSVREKPCALRVVILRRVTDAEHRRDSVRLLEAGAQSVVWVTVHRPEVRSGLAAGLWYARNERNPTLVIESTSAGIELERIDDSWFVAGCGEWKPWAAKHRDRADHVIFSDDRILDDRILDESLPMVAS